MVFTIGDTTRADICEANAYIGYKVVVTRAHVTCLGHASHTTDLMNIDRTCKHQTVQVVRKPLRCIYEYSACCHQDNNHDVPFVNRCSLGLSQQRIQCWLNRAKSFIKPTTRPMLAWYSKVFCPGDLDLEAWLSPITINSSTCGVLLLYD